MQDYIPVTDPTPLKEVKDAELSGTHVPYLGEIAVRFLHRCIAGTKKDVAKEAITAIPAGALSGDGEVSAAPKIMTAKVSKKRRRWDGAL